MEVSAFCSTPPRPASRPERLPCALCYAVPGSASGAGNLRRAGRDDPGGTTTSAWVSIRFGPMPYTIASMPTLSIRKAAAQRASRNSIAMAPPRGALCHPWPPAQNAQIASVVRDPDGVPAIQYRRRHPRTRSSPSGSSRAPSVRVARSRRRSAARPRLDPSSLTMAAYGCRSS
jgi:hypothetical protein